MTLRQLISLFFVGLSVYVCGPLVLPIAMGAVFAVLFFPVYEWIETRRVPAPLAASAMTLLITLLIIFPFVFLVTQGTRAGWTQLRVIQQSAKVAPIGVPGKVSGFYEQILSLPGVDGFFDRLATWTPVTKVELIDGAGVILRNVVSGLANIFGRFVAELPDLLLALAIVVVSIFFFLLDGRRMIGAIEKYSVFSKKQTGLIVESFGEMGRSVLLASFLSSLAQTLIETVALVSTGVPNVALIALLVFFTSFIPLVGSSPVTLGVAVHQLVIGNTTVGIILLVVAIGIIVADATIRAFVIKGGANLHPLIAFIAALGGAKTLGLTGLFLGPVIAGISVTFWRILAQDQGSR